MTDAIDYSTPATDIALRPRPLPAIMLCLPGVICWSALAIGLGVWALRIDALRPMVDQIVYHAGVIFFCWTAAILAAVASVVVYWPRRPRPWYVVLNLIVNLGGLIFTAVVVPGFFIALILIAP